MYVPYEDKKVLINCYNSYKQKLLDNNVVGDGPFEIILQFDVYKNINPDKLLLEAKNIKCLGPNYKSKNIHNANSEVPIVQEKLDWNMENEN